MAEGFNTSISISVEWPPVATIGRSTVTHCKQSKGDPDDLENILASDLNSVLRGLGIPGKFSAKVFGSAMLRFWEYGDPEITPEWETVCRAIEDAMGLPHPGEAVRP